jgi:hypothetical protein
MKSLDFFKDLPNPSDLTMTVELTQPPTEIGTRNLRGSKGRSTLKAELTAIFEPIL